MCSPAAEARRPLREERSLRGRRLSRSFGPVVAPAARPRSGTGPVLAREAAAGSASLARACVRALRRGACAPRRGAARELGPDGPAAVSAPSPARAARCFSARVGAQRVRRWAPRALQAGRLGRGAQGLEIQGCGRRRSRDFSGQPRHPRAPGTSLPETPPASRDLPRRPRPGAFHALWLEGAAPGLRCHLLNQLWCRPFELLSFLGLTCLSFCSEREAGSLV